MKQETIFIYKVLEFIREQYGNETEYFVLVHSVVPGLFYQCNSDTEFKNKLNELPEDQLQSINSKLEFRYKSEMPRN